MARESYRRVANAASEVTFLLVLFLGLALLALIRRVACHPPYPGIDVRQKAQFHSIEAAIELFKNEFDGYPPSDANDSTGKPYCGAMKFAEALAGRDILGFHCDSAFRADGKDANGVAELYLPAGVSYDQTMDITSRRGPYLPPVSADSPTLAQIYGPGNTGTFDPNSRVFCDAFRRKYKGRRLKVGMPVLYYKADTSKAAHDVNEPDNPENIYDYRDNYALLALGVPGNPKKKHPLFADPKLFYRITKSDRITTVVRPFRADTYILISAGKDGLYGTLDDACSFSK